MWGGTSEEQNVIPHEERGGKKKTKRHVLGRELSGTKN